MPSMEEVVIAIGGDKGVSSAKASQNYEIYNNWHGNGSTTIRTGSLKCISSPDVNWHMLMPI